MSYVVSFYPLVLILFATYAIVSNRSIFKLIKRFISSINESYMLFYNNQNKKIKIIIVVLLISNLLFSSYLTLFSYMNDSILSGFVKLLFSIFSFYIIFGIPFLMIQRIKISLGDVKNTKLLWLFFMNFLYIYLYTIYSFIPDELYNYSHTLMIALMVSYIVNMRVLFLFIEHLKYSSKNESTKKDTRKIYMSALLLLILIVFTLYLGTFTIAKAFPNSFVSSTNQTLNPFDYFYYTVITFSTIGYGDIVPTNIISKSYSILISITSIICLVIFINSLMDVDD